MSRVLVIGASGSLGSVVAEQLSQKNQVTGTYCSRQPMMKSDRVEYRQLDITDKTAFEKMDTDYDCVVLVSGAMPATMPGYVPQRYIDVNITGTLNTLEFCRQTKIPKLIFIMTFSDVSGAFYSGVPISTEQSRTLVMTGDHAVYGISKATACDLIEHYHQEYGLQTIVFRIPTVYCADDNVDFYVDGVKRTKAYVKMIRSVVQHKKIEIWGNPEHAKDIPYVKDFSRLIELAVSSKTAQGLYNAGTGSPVTLEQLVNEIIQVFAGEETVEKTYRPEMASQPNFTFDMSKTEADFGYQPQYDLRSMLMDIRDSVDPAVWLTSDL